MNKTLAIIGSHPNAKAFDFDRQDVDIYAFNEALANGWLKRADVIFQMHAPAIWKNPGNRNDPNHAKWLMSGETPRIMMQEKYPDVPKAERYPLEDVLALFGNFDKRYFTSSIAYAIAYGIYSGYRNIEIWGVEMETDTEYRYQRDGATFWIGVAVGRGINVRFFGKVFDAPLYGYDGEVDIDPADFQIRLREIGPELKSATDAYNRAKDQADKALLYFHDTGKGGAETSAAIQTQIQAAYSYGIVDGARQELERYVDKSKLMLGAAGAFIFSRQEFESSAQELAKNRDEAQRKAAVLAGMAQQIFDDAKAMKNRIKQKHMLARKFAPALAEYIRESIFTGIYTGAHLENINFLTRLDALIKAAGGIKSEQLLLEKEQL